MKPGVKPIEARVKAGQGSNLSTGTSHNCIGVSSKERRGLRRFCFWYFPWLTAKLTAKGEIYFVLCRSRHSVYQG